MWLLLSGWTAGQFTMSMAALLAGSYDLARKLRVGNSGI